MRIVVLVLLLQSVSAGAQNLITNGDFAADLSGWSERFSSVAVWSPEDIDGSDQSGSVVLRDVGELGIDLSQCLSPEPLGTSEVEFSYFVPADVITVFDRGLGVSLVWHDDPDCQGTTLDAHNVLEEFIVRGRWVSIRDTVMRPLGADSLRVQLLLLGSGLSDFTARFDNIFVGDRLFSDGFEGTAP